MRPDFFDSNLTIYPALQIRGVDIRAGPNRKGLFHYRAGSGRVLKKSWVAGGFGSCRSVEIFDRVYMGTLFTLEYFRVDWVLREHTMFRFT